MAIFAGSVAVAGAFSGLLATGISFMNGLAGLSGWQWLFILEGIPAVLCGAAVWIWMPNYPNDASFLTEEERLMATVRMGPFAPSANDKHFDKAIAKKTLTEPLFWVFAIQYFLMTNSLNAFGYFAPTIVASLGFKGYTAQLLTVPPNVFALICIICNCLHSDFTKERTRHVIGGLVFVSIGYLLLAVVTNWIVRYVAVFLIACTNAAVLPFLAVSGLVLTMDVLANVDQHRTATVTGSTATALATGGIIALANCGGISAPFLFPSTDGPRYRMGNWTVFAFLAVSVGITVYLGWKLGTGSEYRDIKQTAGEDLAEIERRESAIGQEARHVSSIGQHKV